MKFINNIVLVLFINVFTGVLYTPTAIAGNNAVVIPADNQAFTKLKDARDSRMRSQQLDAQTIEFAQQVSQAAERIYGYESAELANAQYNLGFIYLKRSEFIEAETAFLKSISIAEKSLRPSDSRTFLYVWYLAQAYAGQKAWSKAATQYERAIVLKEPTKFSVHLLDLASMYYMNREHTKAATVLLHAADLAETPYAFEHVSKSSHVLANNFLKNNNASQAIPLLERELMLLQKFDAKPEVISAANKLINEARQISAIEIEKRKNSEVTANNIETDGNVKNVQLDKNPNVAESKNSEATKSKAPNQKGKDNWPADMEVGNLYFVKNSNTDFDSDPIMVSANNAQEAVNRLTQAYIKAERPSNFKVIDGGECLGPSWGATYRAQPAASSSSEFAWGAGCGKTPALAIQAAFDACKKTGKECDKSYLYGWGPIISLALSGNTSWSEYACPKGTQCSPVDQDKFGSFNAFSIDRDSTEDYIADLPDAISKLNRSCRGWRPCFFTSVFLGCFATHWKDPAVKCSERRLNPDGYKGPIRWSPSKGM